jgi:outer membrane protein
MGAPSTTGTTVTPTVTLLLLHARRVIALAAVLACSSLSAFAQTPAEDASSSSVGDAATPSRWGLGLGVASRQRPYAGVERKNNVLPVLYFENRWVRVAGAGAEFKLARHAFSPTQALSGGLRLKYDDDGYEADDSPRLGGMDERKGGFWGGAVATWHNPIVQLSAEWLADLSGHSKGQKFLLQAERRFAWGSFSLTPRVQAQWLDKKYVDYYYGVRAHEVLPDRVAYAGASALAAEAGLRMDYALNARHAVFVDLSATRLPDEITLSPIVERRNASRVAAGYLYRF